MKKIILLILLSFISLLGYSQEGFETGIPATWTVFDNGVGTVESWHVTTVLANVHSGVQAAEVNRENIGAGNTSEDWLVMPLQNIPTNGQLDFWTRKQLTGDRGSIYQIRLSSTTATGPTDTASYTIIQSYTELQIAAVANVYEEKLISLAAYAGTNRYIAFVRVNSQPLGATSGDKWLVDDVKVQQQCFDPTALSASNISATSATLGWLNGAPFYDIQYGPSGFILNSPSGTIVTNFPNNSVLSGLTPGTSYQFYVKAKCTGGSESAWTGPFNFNTTPLGATCAGPKVVGTLPFCDTSNTSIYGNNVSAASPGNLGCGVAGGYLAGNDVVYTYNPTFTGQILITMDPLGSTNTGMFVYSSCSNIGISCIGGVGNTGSGVRTITAQNVTLGVPLYIVLSSLAATPTFPYTLCVQKVNCVQPIAGVATTITPYTATINWTNGTGSTSTSWQYVVQTVPNTIPGAGVTGTTVTTTNAAITGLLPSTCYQYWVNATCGDGTVSAWTGPISFCTPASCLQPTGLGLSNVGTTTVLTNWTSPGTAASWQIIAVLSTDPAPTALTPGWQTANAHPYTITGLLPDTCYKFYVRGDCGAVDGLSLISGPSAQFCTLATCIKPTVLTTTLITTTSVQLGWTSAGTATSWQVLILPTGSPAPTVGATGWIAAPTNPFAYPTALTPNTCYDFYVRGDCGAVNGMSVWSGPKAFCTLATCPIPTLLGTSTPLSTSVNVTWTPTTPSTSFEVIAVPTGSPAPANNVTTGVQAATGSPYTYTGLTGLTCYDFYVRGVCTATDSSNWAGPVSNCTQATPPACGGTFVDAGGTTANYPNSSDSIVTICPTISGQQVTVTFTSFDTEVNWDGLYVFDGSSIASPQIASANGPGTVPGGVPGSYWGLTIPGPFTSTAADGCLTFRFRSDGSVNHAGWVANVTCAPPPTCPQPTALTTAFITATSVDFGWTNVGPATGWQYIAVPCGSPTPTAATVGWTATATNPVSITGLTSGTCYDLYVRGDCASTSNGISLWAGPKSFTTLIAPPICGGNFVDDAGISANYANNSDSTVTICPAAGQVVTVTFTQFDTEANWDGLYVFDGSTINSPQIASANGPGTVPGGLAGSYWGTTIPGPFTSTAIDGCLTFRFRSDGSVNHPGWAANITCAPAPTCGKPTALTFSTITPFTATLSWVTNQPGVSSTWQVLALPVGSPIPNAFSTGWQVASSTTNFVYTGLLADTCYNYYVRGNCGATDGVSLWSVASAQFCTPPTCIAPTNLTVGQILPTSVSLSWAYTGTATSWQVIVLPVGSPAPTLTTPATGWSTATTNTNYSYTGIAPNTLVPNTAYQYYVRADCGAVDGVSVWVAAPVTFTTPPTCPQPVNLGSAAVAGGGSATLTWDANPTTSNWSVQWQVQGAGAPTGNGNVFPSLNTNSYTIPAPPAGLTPGFYEFYVRSNCTATDSSLWSGPFLFYINPPQPACAEVNVPLPPNVASNGIVELCKSEDGSPNCIDLTASYIDSKNTTSYLVSSIPFIPPFPFVGGTELPITVDDIWSAPFTLPFNFCFYGTNYPTINVGSNGVVDFGANHVANSNCPWAYTATVPNTTFPILNAIYGVYQDMNPSVSTAPLVHSINYQVLGTAPCRVFVVNYNLIPQFQCNLTAGLQTSQIVLYETSNNIEVYVKDRTTCSTWNSGNGLIGIQNSTGTVADVPPGRNTGSWETHNEAWRFTPNGASQVAFTWLTNGTPLVDPTNVTQHFCVTQTTTVTAQATYTGCGGTQIVKQTPILLHVNDINVPIIADVTSCVPVNLADLPTLPNGGIYYNQTGGVSPVVFPIAVSQTVYAYNATAIVSPATTPICSDEELFQVIIQGSPTETTFTYPTPVCNNAPDISPTTGTGFTPGGTYSSTTGLIIDPSTGLISVSASLAGTYVVTYTVAASACQAAGASTFTVVINSNATLGALSYTQPACANSGSYSPIWTGGTTGTGGGSTAGGTYTATPPGLSIDPVTGVIDTALSLPGNYMITYTLASNTTLCTTGGSATFNFILDPNIILGSGFSYPTPVCINDPINPGPTLDPGTTPGGVFSALPTGLAIDPVTGIIDLSLTTIGTYTVQYCVGGLSACILGGCSTFTVVITGVVTPDTTISYVTPVCKINPVNPGPITDAGFNTGGVYTSVPAMAIDPVTGVINLSATAAGSYVITYSVAAFPPCQVASSSSFTVVISAPTIPGTDFTYTTPICQNSATSPAPIQGTSYTAGGTYTSTPGLTIDPLTGVIDLATSTAGNYCITYTVAQDDSICQAANSTQFCITIDPVITPTTNFTYTTPVCVNGSVNPTPIAGTNMTPGGTYSSISTVIDLDPTTGVINLANTPAGTYNVTYTVAANTATCQVMNSTTFTIVINTAVIPVTAFSYISPVCQTDPVTQMPILAVSFTTGGTYTSTAGLTLDPNTGAIIPTTSLPATYVVTYSVLANSTNCQIAGSSQATIVITTGIVATTNFSYATPVCQNAGTNPAPITPTGFTTGGTYSSTPIGLTLNAGTGVIDLANSTAGTYTVTYSVAANAASCLFANSSTAPITITATVTPVTDFSYPAAVCISDTTNPSPTMVTGFTPGGTFSSTPGITVNPSTGVIDLATSSVGTYAISYTVGANAANCQVANTTSHNITIAEVPVFTVDGGCFTDGTYVLSVNPAPGTGDTSTYIWTDAANVPFGTSTPTVVITTPGLYHLTVTSAAGCSTIEDFNATSISCTIQRGISPNDDGLNDNFDLAGLNVRYLSIYNRYGMKVYSFANYTNEWKGQSDKGTELPDATYYYVLHFDNGPDKTGWIYINKERK